MAKRKRVMPYFCPQCTRVQERPNAAGPADLCATCQVPLRPVLDATGALTREYLLARHKCCENFCKNCPYGHPALALAEADAH